MIARAAAKLPSRCNCAAEDTAAGIGGNSDDDNGDGDGDGDVDVDGDGDGDDAVDVWGVRKLVGGYVAKARGVTVTDDQGGVSERGQSCMKRWAA